VEAKVAAVHQIDDNVAVQSQSLRTRTGHDNVQVLYVLEAVSEIAEEGVVEMLEHAPLANNVADTLRPYDCYTASASVVYAQTN
jgi:hypothetical protein